MDRRNALPLIVAFAAVLASAAEPDSRMVAPADGVRGRLPSIQPTPAGDAVLNFRVLDGFRMDLLAAEPLVASPVAMAYDEAGRAYVCEMRDYPYTDKQHHQRNQENPTDQAIGTVRLLEDQNGDGAFDKSTVFAEGLSWPTGVACWKGGVFVAATPDLWYLKDTDGDGKADIRRKVFTGFRKFNVQAVMNNLVWSLDNHIHGAGSKNGGQITADNSPAGKAVTLGRHDFRFDPATEKFELVSGGAHFGGTFDDWGHRFLCDIRNPAQHVVWPERYLARNPYLAAPSPLHDMAEAGDQLPVYRLSPAEQWRVLRAKRWAGQRDIVMPRSELVGAGVVTSSSGVTSYRGAAYPEKYHGNVFVCECAGNLFYRLQLAADGPTFKATRVDRQAEMVASTDSWFRPVNLINAPDGTLHVMDMYRENIEHPWSIPDDIHAAVDLESGRDRGRIWRLTPPVFKAPKTPRLGRATSLELVAILENPNSWWRETAQRLLVERQDQSVVLGLRKLVTGGRTAQARLHALWTLEGLHALREEDVLAGLRDPAAGVRENAVKLAEQRIDSARILEALLQRVSDSDIAVRFQLAFTLGESRERRALDGLTAIAARDARDSWIRTAVLSSVGKASDQLLVQCITNRTFASSDGSLAFIGELAQIIGRQGRTQEMQRVLAFVGKERTARGPIFREVVSGVGEGLKRSGLSLRSIAWDAETDAALDGLLSEAAPTAADMQAAPGARNAAIRLLTFDIYSRAEGVLSRLLEKEQPDEIQRAAVNAIGSFSQAETATVLLARWKTSAPGVRSEIVLAMLSGRYRILPLLRAIEDGLIPAHQVPFARRAALLRSGDAAVKELAMKIYGDAVPRPRQEVIAKYQSALSHKGDAARGRAVFESNCATCHRLGDLGQDVGPNLAATRQWSPEQMLINILDPNREVMPNFVGYTIETKDGRTLDGLIAEEGAASITLKNAGGLKEVVFRRDIARISGTGLSLMPENLESAVTVEQMADLIEFLLAAP